MSMALSVLAQMTNDVCMYPSGKGPAYSGPIH